MWQCHNNRELKLKFARPKTWKEISNDIIICYFWNLAIKWLVLPRAHYRLVKLEVYVINYIN